MHRNNLHSYTLTTREEQYGGFLKIKIDLPFDQATPLLGIYPEETIIQKDTCTPMFTAALFTIARKWKQPKCSSNDQWIKKMWLIYTIEYYSVVQRNKINKIIPFAATWRDLEIVILNQVRPRDTNFIYCLYMESKKKCTNKHCAKHK